MKLKWILLLLFPILTSGIIYKVVKFQCFNATGGYSVVDRCEEKDNLISFTITYLKVISVQNVLCQFFANHNGNLQPIFNIPKFDLCGGNPKSPNLQTALQKHLLNVMSSEMPQLLKPCPWQPPITVVISNFTVENKFMMLIPKGLYRMIWTAREADASILFKMIIDAEIFY